MNKNDISKKVYEAHGGLSYADSQKIVDFILETIKGRLSQGEKVLIIDRDEKSKNDRTWCFWQAGPSLEVRLNNGVIAHTL